jgi:DivIVA domain-containing protein
MELTPKVLRDVQFRDRTRGAGYHHEDVDEFLEQAALGVEALLEKLRLATERAQRAEQAAAEASATDEALKRMLLMAQRTADQAVREAREEGDAMVAEARSQAESILADAEEGGRRAYESALAEGRASMEQAHEALRQVQREVEDLRGWVDMHKGHLLTALRDATAVVESLGLLSEPPLISSTNGGSVSVPEVDQSEIVLSSPVTQASHGAAEEVAPTGGWDQSYLEGLPVQPGSPEHSEAGQPREGAQMQSQPTGAPVAGASLSQDPTIAIDERALDTFFSDQDLGDERGQGRFRRHQ